MRTYLWWIALALVPALVALTAASVTPPNLDRALETQRALAAEYPDDPRVFNDLGNLLVMGGRLDEAEEAYLHAIELDPDRASSHFNLALLLQQAGQLRPALKEYQQVLRIDPGHAWAQYQIGTIYDRWRQDDRAVQAYARALSLDPQLAFSEVNPHVIDNRLLTEALLKAHRRPASTVLPPKSYDEPSRIAQLLIPQAPMPPQDDQEGDEGDETGEAETREAQQPLDEDEATRMLTRGDLDPGATANQAAPPAGSSVGSRYRPSRGRFQGRSNVRQLRPRVNRNPLARQQHERQPRTGTQRGQELGGATVVPGSSQGRGGDEGSGNPGRDLAPSSGASPRGGSSGSGGFQPGTASTGRLDIELILPPAAVDVATERLAAK